MIVALITDTHWGVRNDNPVLLKQTIEFHENLFFPILEERNIKEIIHLGDLVDKRKYINYKTLQAMKHSFFRPLRKKDIGLTIFPGNHDCTLKHSLKINALTSLLSRFQNVEVITEPSHYSQAPNIGLVPWICSENSEACLEFIQNTGCSVLMGHFEIKGFEMFRGQINTEHGLTTDLFSHFDKVFSGHFHHKSRIGNIFYLGAPYETMWSDYNDPRGFHIFDTESGHLEFIQNPNSMFHRIEYDDTEDYTIERLLDSGILNKIPDKYVKLVVKKKENPFIFDGFLEEIHKAQPYNLSIIHEISSATLTEGEEPVDTTKDILSILIEAIQNLKMQPKVQFDLINVVSSLYTEAIDASQNSNQ